MENEKPKNPRYLIVITIMMGLFTMVAALADVAGSYIKDPETSTEYFQQAVSFESKGDYENATIFYKKEIEQNPENAAACNALSWLYIDKLDKNYEEAITLAQTAVSLTEQHEQTTENKYLLANYLDTLGWAYYKNGDLENSITSLERAIELHDQESYKKHLSIVQEELKRQSSE